MVLGIVFAIWLVDNELIPIFHLYIYLSVEQSFLVIARLFMSEYLL
jgi:hypothetical protein